MVCSGFLVYSQEVPRGILCHGFYVNSILWTDHSDHVGPRGTTWDHAVIPLRPCQFSMGSLLTPWKTSKSTHAKTGFLNMFEIWSRYSSNLWRQVSIFLRHSNPQEACSATLVQPAQEWFIYPNLSTMHITRWTLKCFHTWSQHVTTKTSGIHQEEPTFFEREWFRMDFCGFGDHGKQ